MIDDLEALDAELAAVGLDTDTADLDDPMADLSLDDKDDEDPGDLEDDLNEDDVDDDPDVPADDVDVESAGDGTDSEDLAPEDPADVDDEPAVLASTILEEELDDKDMVMATILDDEDDEDEVREGEFVCQSCFMAKRETALADEDAMLCLDCV